MPTIPAQLAFPPHQRPRRRRAFLLGRFGLMPLPPYGARACPQIAEWIPPGCTARIVTDPNGCTRRVAVCPSGPQTPPAIAASSPVPANFPTNQIFVAPDGSQWMYSSSQGQWISIGTPYSVGAPPSSAPAPVPSPAPVSVTVAPPPVAAAAASPYQSILDFATQDTLIRGIPNWMTGVLGFLGYKLLEQKFASGGRH